MDKSLKEGMLCELERARFLSVTGCFHDSIRTYDSLTSRLNQFIKKSDDVSASSEADLLLGCISTECDLTRTLNQAISSTGMASLPNFTEDSSSFESEGIPRSTTRESQTDRQSQLDRSRQDRPPQLDRSPVKPPTNSRSDGPRVRASRWSAEEASSADQPMRDASTGGVTLPARSTATLPRQVMGGNAVKDSSGGNPRSYSKPWLASRYAPPPSMRGDGMLSRSGSSTSQAGGSALTSAYARYVYPPEGSGPDAELIAAIERDAVFANSRDNDGERPNTSEPNNQTRSVSRGFGSVAGLDKVKELLEEAVILPQMVPELFTGVRKPWRGILLYGPPGTGKTMLVRALAAECEATFFSISTSTLASKYRGESEKLVRILFDMARFYRPSVVFLDEIDAICGSRGESSEHEASRRVKAELLVQMDGLHLKGDSASVIGEASKDSASSGITVIAATNRPWDLDEAIRRRLEKRIFVDLPDVGARKHILATAMETTTACPSAMTLDAIVAATEGYSGADLSILCRDACMMPVRRRVTQARGNGASLKAVAEHLSSSSDYQVTRTDFDEALRRTPKSVSTADVSKFVQWMTRFGSVID